MQNQNLPPHPFQDEVLQISPQGLARLSAEFDPKEPGKHIYWTTDYTMELPIAIKKSGPGSEPAITLIELIEASVLRNGKRPAMRVKREGQWKTWSYEDFYRDIKNFANGLISLGVPGYKALNIIGFNDPAWFIGFYGAIFSNIIPVGVYTTNGAEACRYIAEHSDAQVILAEDNIQLKKYLEIWETLPNVKYIIVYNEKALPAEIPLERRSQIFLLKDFLEYGAKFGSQTNDEMLQQRKDLQKPGNCCTIVYTSGTTGPPKGVMLSHDNYTWLCQRWKQDFISLIPNSVEEESKVVSYLPLSHVAAQYAEMIFPFELNACVHFALPTALQGTIIDTLKEVRPDVLLSVPRLWEKIEETLKAMGHTNTFPKKNIAEWAKSIGVEGTLAELENKPKPFAWGLAKAIVYNNVKKALGMDKCRALFYGAAPLSETSRRYFASLNLFLINSYGMSECAGPQTYYVPGKGTPPSLKSASLNTPGTEMMINAPDAEGNGEICFRGRNRFMGYFKDEASTKATIDEQGFIHSGDIGIIDKDGHLHITGRLKELIITAGGENVAPVLIEEQIKAVLPFISQCVVIGDNKKYLSLLYTIKHEPAPEMTFTDNLSAIALGELKRLNIEGKNTEELRKDANFLKYVAEQIEKVNAKAASRAQGIRKWTLLNGDFTINGGELTPTLKLKRKIIAHKYGKEIESMYLDPKL